MLSGILMLIWIGLIFNDVIDLSRIYGWGFLEFYVLFFTVFILFIFIGIFFSFIFIFIIHSCKPISIMKKNSMSVLELEIFFLTDQVEKGNLRITYCPTSSLERLPERAETDSFNIVTQK